MFSSRLNGQGILVFSSRLNGQGLSVFSSRLNGQGLCRLSAILFVSNKVCCVVAVVASWSQMDLHNMRIRPETGSHTYLSCFSSNQKLEARLIWAVSLYILQPLNNLPYTNCKCVLFRRQFVSWCFYLLRSSSFPSYCLTVLLTLLEGIMKLHPSPCSFRVSKIWLVSRLFHICSPFDCEYYVIIIIDCYYHAIIPRSCCYARPKK